MIVIVNGKLYDSDDGETAVTLLINPQEKDTISNSNFTDDLFSFIPNKLSKKKVELIKKQAIDKLREYRGESN